MKLNKKPKNDNLTKKIAMNFKKYGIELVKKCY